VRIAYVFAERDRPVQRSTGHSVHVQEMARAFAELGHEVDLVAGIQGDEGVPPPGVRVHELTPRLLRPRPARHDSGAPGHRTHAGEFAETRWAPSTVGRDLSRITWWRVWTGYFYRRSRRVLDKRPPALVYERYVLGSWVGARLARELRVPLVVELNASFTYPEEWWAPHSPLYPLSVRRNERRVVTAATAVAAVSQALRRHCLDLGVPEERIAVIPNAADTERFRPDAADAARVRSRYGFENRHVVVGFIGSLKPWHGVEHLLDATAQVAREMPQLRVLIVGDGPLRSQLESIVDGTLAERVRFAGYVPRQDAPAHIAAMDIAAVPYPPMANFHFSPIKLFESMAVGRPVVASGYPDVAAVIEHRRTGVLVEPGDVDALAQAIRELAGDPDLRGRLGVAARRAVEQNHTWRHNAEAVIRIVEASRAGPRA
jgi:glycosyltransferase involved in cell wall biosynthesis